ncbi:MAG: hypothetical protein RBT64_04465 [Trichloromonas sp.]|jgi:hypothetical protein|nr:hypothetical protein [Trichloromonas sp.]
MSPTTAQTIACFAAVAAAQRVGMTRLGRPDPAGRFAGRSQRRPKRLRY